MKRWLAFLPVVVALRLAVAGPIHLPVYLEDNHAGSFYWLAAQLDLEEPHTLLHFDAHSDASGVFDSDTVRERMRRVPSRSERVRVLERWRRLGAVQCFSWIEPLMPAPIAEVIWIPPDEMLAREGRKLADTAGELLDGHLEASPRIAGPLRSHFSVMSLAEARAQSFSARPLLASIDLDSFAGLPVDEQARALENIWSFIAELRDLRAVTIAISRPYLRNDSESDALVQLALRAALSLPTAQIHFEPFRTVGNDRSTRANELRARGREVPAFDLTRASPELRALLLANASRIAVHEAKPRWHNLLQQWRDEAPTFRVSVKNHQPSTDNIWRVPVGEAAEIELLAEPWYAELDSVRWIVEMPRHLRCNLTATNRTETAFAHDATPRPRWREEVLRESSKTIPLTALRPFFDAATGWGSVRVRARVETAKWVRETPAIEIRRFSGTGFRAALTEQLGLPYLFGSGALRDCSNTGPETGWGADCANFVAYALRRQGLRIPWSNPKQLRGFLAPREEATLTAAEVERGVVVHFGNHVAALLEDRAPVGVLDPSDLIVHQLEGVPETLTLGTLQAQRSAARFDIYTVPPPPDQTDLIIGGDVMLGRSVGVAIAAGCDPLAGIRSLFSSAGNVLVNLECTLGGTAAPAANKRYTFRGPGQAAAMIAAAGINVVGLANNHADDFGAEGLAETRAILDQNNITTVDSLAPRILATKDGRRIAILAFSDLTAEARPSAESIAVARAASDLLVCFVHWGEENRVKVTERQRELARWLIDQGVDLVAGSHPHTVQPLDYYRGCAIIYSLGNLVFDGAPSVRDWNRGALARITLTGRRGAAVRLVPVELDRRGFPQPTGFQPPATNSLATTGAARSRRRVIGLSKNR